MDMLILIFIGVLSRLAPHPANMTAVGALAIFSGSRYSRIKGIVVTAGAMFISDLVLGFHSVMWATYGSLACSVLLANYFLRKRTVAGIAGITLLSSVVFYIVTNFAVWAVPGSIYPKSLSGLFESYIMAIPFFRNSIFGDIFYSGVFFSAYELIVSLRRKIALFRIDR